MLNTLSYGLLGLLASDSCSGYDLMLRIQPFWPAKHSQIYPLLAKLEREGLVQFVRIEQRDKPDKKVYSITEQGKSVVLDWLGEPPAEQMTRDELSLKTKCIWMTEKEITIPLFLTRMKQLETKTAYFEKLLDRISEEDRHIRSKHFGDYILLHRAISLAAAQIEWCRWVVQMLEQEDSDS
ncbi:PadR-like family transcriptional regulator [Paenibacillus alvei TS-15]|uniref:PadR-like family transcriptional regulator n=3 Tax=Paenibacillus TaxID=44249 RepID=S9U169_PAEAL|nr:MULTISPECIES: PadR family transcriptional regulator [Paenibacillus]EPY04300.1 PadR-like family transcriptional regulator [Paenibacillus alvei TS-15]EPY13281.1 PadR-like family transcriptional regulator [Paenibacillus alvei A6-6i-x]MCM3289865.1 PadR family transcriptional regulator [Paenibacillus sp. MER 180]MCY9532876.1 PadR family transcriptional regulator [Paenibacillus alvei]MDT8976194.1 PadR family transcriptional regulator [Paenibacillus sp. chi10]